MIIIFFIIVEKGSYTDRKEKRYNFFQKINEYQKKLKQKYLKNK